MFQFFRSFWVSVGYAFTDLVSVIRFCYIREGLFESLEMGALFSHPES